MATKKAAASRQAKIVEETKDGNIRTTFDEPKVTNGLRALQIWQILIGKANNRQLVTYKDLAG